MRNVVIYPRAPVWVAIILERAPLAILGHLPERLGQEVRKNHPAILERLQGHAEATVLIDPCDLPFVFRLQPTAAKPMKIQHRSDACAWDARITAPLLCLLAMFQGDEDGDALFFSREVEIEGDTETVLALRNALDAAEIDLIGEFFSILGPLGAAGVFLRGSMASFVRRRSSPTSFAAKA